MSPASPDRAIIVFSPAHEGLTDGTLPGGSNDVRVVFPVDLAAHASTILDARGRTRTARSFGGEAAADSCGNAQQLQAGAIAEAVRVGHDFYWFGLVPDAVHTVQIRSAAGHTSSVAVHDNFFDALRMAAPNPPAGVMFNWLGAGGQRVGPAAR